MITELEDIGARIRRLSIDDKYALLRDLMDELEETADRSLEAAWVAEIRRRQAEIDSGADVLIPAEQVYAEMDSLVRR